MMKNPQPDVPAMVGVSHVEKNSIHQFSGHMTHITEAGAPQNNDSIQCFQIAFFSCWYLTGGRKQLKPSSIREHTEQWSMMYLVPDVNKSAVFIFLVIIIQMGQPGKQMLTTEQLLQHFIAQQYDVTGSSTPSGFSTFLAWCC
jgi:hypothetical protein